MKLVTGNNALESNLAGRAEVFKIAANAKAFRALSSTLYKEQVWSILRELACNAQDAHIQAGHRKPIQIKLPNLINRDFYVQDFGPGLSPEGIRDLYTTYFSSSKDQSNDQTGAFGLGSKSPFAYTDQFTVVSAHAGVEITYLAYLQDGEPSILEVSRRPVDPQWPSGIRVSFPVKNQDFNAFAEEATRLCWMDPVPQISGADLVLETPKKLWSYGPLALYELTENQRQRRIYREIGVLMGGIFYPAELPEVVMPYAASGTLVLHAPIGAVEVALSRESLSMTEYTRKGLRTLMAEAIRCIEDEVRTLFETYPTYKEAFSGKAQELYGLLDWFKTIRTQNSLLLKGDPFQLPGLENCRKKCLRVKPIGNFGNFQLVEETDYGISRALHEPVLFCRAPEGKSEAWLRDRIRAMVLPVWPIPDKQKALRVLLILGEPDSGWDALERRLGWPIVDLEKVVLPKKADTRVKTHTVRGLELEKRHLDSYIAVSNPGSCFVEKELTVTGTCYVMLGYYSSKYNCTAENSFDGLNNILERLGEPKADRLMLVYTKKAFTALVSQGALDFNALVQRNLGRLSLEANTLLPDTQVPSGLSGLLTLWDRHLPIRQLLQNTDLGRFIQKFWTRENRAQLQVSHMLQRYSRALNMGIDKDLCGSDLDPDFKQMIQAVNELAPLSMALNVIPAYILAGQGGYTAELDAFVKVFLRPYTLPAQVKAMLG